jgi:hypothetical protein
MNVRAFLICACAASLLGGCAGNRTMSTPQTQNVFDKPPTAQESRAFDAVRAKLKEQLRSGMTYSISGTASSVVVKDGKPSQITVGPGNLVRVSLVRGNTPQFRLWVEKGVGSPNYVNPADPWGDPDGGGAATPAPAPTEPPNVSSCTAAGGVAWGTPTGTGCLGPGSSHPMSCGVWQFIAPGKGQLITNVNGTILVGSWIADDGGGTCNVGS